MEEAPCDADGGAAERDWSGLQPELLELITRKINEIEDFIRFGAVCKSWRSSTISTNLKPQVPWAVLPSGPNSSTRSFCSVSTNTIHTLHLPECRGRVLAGTPHGWLVMADVSFSLSLFNPLSRAQIPLPSFPIFPPDQIVHIFGAAGGERRIVKMYMFIDRGEFIVVVCFCKPPRISYCRSGDAAWTTIRRSIFTWVIAVAYHDGRLYALDKSMGVRVCDLSRGADEVFVLIPSLQPPTITPAIGYQFGATSAGELLLITAHQGPSEGQVQFSVYKSDTRADQPTWSEARGIGGDLTLFVSRSADGYGDFIAFLDDDASRCKKNCAYGFGDAESLISHGIQIHYLGENDEVSEHAEFHPQQNCVMSTWMQNSERGIVGFLENAEFDPLDQNYVISTWMTPSLC